jgi:hypothetical protein
LTTPCHEGHQASRHTSTSEPKCLDMKTVLASTAFIDEQTSRRAEDGFASVAGLETWRASISRGDRAANAPASQRQGVEWLAAAAGENNEEKYMSNIANVGMIINIRTKFPTLVSTLAAPRRTRDR